MLSSSEYQIQVQIITISDKSWYYGIIEIFLSISFVINRQNIFAVSPDDIRNMYWKYQKSSFRNMFIFWSGKHEIYPYSKLRYSCIQDSYLDSFQIQIKSSQLVLKLFTLYKEY